MQPLTYNDSDLPTIEALKDRATWGLRGRLLHQAKSSRQWAKRGEHTFGRFIQRCAQGLGVHETTVWRDLGAYTYFTETLVPKLKAAGIAIEGIEEIAKIVSPEHLVILDRIERVAPPADFLKIASQVVAGEVPRSTLRVYWDSLKPALEGKAARGSNEKPRARGSVLEEMVRATFTTADPAWTGIEKPFAFEAFVGDDALQLDLAGQPPYRPDVITVVQETASSKPVFHAVTVRAGLPKGGTPDFLAAVECFDAFWLAMPELYDIPYHSSSYNLPDTVGLLRVHDDQVEVVRRPSWDIGDLPMGAKVETPKHLGKRTGEIAIALLSKRIKRH